MLTALTALQKPGHDVIPQNCRIFCEAIVPRSKLHSAEDGFCLGLYQVCELKAQCSGEDIRKRLGHKELEIVDVRLVRQGYP